MNELENFSHDPAEDDQETEWTVTDAGAANWAVEKIKERESDIKKAEQKRDELITNAQRIFDEDTEPLKRDIENFTCKLRSYAEKNLIGKKRSVNLPAGKLKFSKQPKRIFFDGEKATATSEKLLAWCQKNHPEFVKEKKTYSVDWDNLKKTLLIVEKDGAELCEVCNSDGEVIKEFTCEIPTDKFSVVTGGVDTNDA